MSKLETITIRRALIRKIYSAINAALAYEKATKGNRRLGITAEVGEILACYKLGLRLVIYPQSKGFDAIDKAGLHVQIKTRRREPNDLPKEIGRLGHFSKHEFDYALYVILTEEYKLYEIWLAYYEKLKPLIESQGRTGPRIRSFKQVARRVFPKRR